jgi:hypothetical protein
MILDADQRGFPRPSGGRCDIGAFEFQYARVKRPSCTLAAKTVQVRLRARSPSGRPRAVNLFTSVSCNQTASVRLEALFSVGRGRRVKQFLSPVATRRVGAHARKKIALKVPQRVLKGLRAHKRVTVRYLLVVFNEHGIRYQNVGAGRLRARG